jgi:16S rRNA (cytidine1402-2'-O)-methyltransferase
VARELSKIYEEFIRGPVTEILAAVSRAAVRGEIVILIAPGEVVQEQTEALDTLLQRFLDEEGLSVKDAARKAALITGGSRNEAYSEALRLRNEAEQH